LEYRLLIIQFTIIWSRISDTKHSLWKLWPTPPRGEQVGIMGQGIK